MWLESIKDNVPMTDVLKEIFLQESLNYIATILLINEKSPEKSKMFLKTLEGEFKLLCTIRKFTIVNTNVVRENQTRILENDSLRSFYFEVFKSMVYRLDLDYNEKDRQSVFKTLLGSTKQPPCSIIIFSGVINHLIRRDQDYKNLCGSVFVEETVIEQYIASNPWYFSVILANMFAAPLLENLKVIGDVS